MRRLAPAIMLVACGAPQVSDHPVAATQNARVDRTAPPFGSATDQGHAPAGETNTVATRTPHVVTAPAPVPMPEPPAIQTLAKPGELFMLVVNNQGQPRCQRFAIEPEQHRMTSTGKVGTRAATTTLSYHVAGHQIVIDASEIRSGDDWSRSCEREGTFEAREADDAIVAGSATWFRTAAGCAGAIAHHARVAELECTIDRETATSDRTSRHKFEAILTHGGTMYSVVDGPQGDFCQAIKLKPYSREPHVDVVSGDLSYPIVRSGVHGIETYQYDMRLGADQVALSGPSTKMDDGVTSGLGCGSEETVRFLPGAVELQTMMYFTAARCRSATAEAKAIASWFPALPGDQADPADKVATAPTSEDHKRAHDIGGPAIGGC